jgi:hypothetical protein
VEGKLFKSIGKNYLVLKDFNFKLIDNGDSFLKSRTKPLFYKSAHGINIGLKITYPKKYSVDYLVKNKIVENKIGKYINRAIKNEKNTILFNYIRVLKKNGIEVSEYNDFKEIGDKSLNKKDLIVLIK